MNETVGKNSLSLLCLKSLSTHNTFQGLKCQQVVKNDYVFLYKRVCTRVSMYVCMCEFVCLQLDRQFPKLGLFSIMFYVSLLLNQLGA